MARSQTGSLGGTNHGLRIEYSTPAMDYRTQTRTEAHPKIRPYARSVRKTGLGHQHDRADGLAALQVAVGLLGVLEPVVLADRDGDGARGDRVEQFSCAP